MRKYKLILVEEKLNDRLEPTDRRIIMNDQIIELNDGHKIDCVNFLCNDLINHYINYCQNDKEFTPVKPHKDTKWQKLKEFIIKKQEEYQADIIEQEMQGSIPNSISFYARYNLCNEIQKKMQELEGENAES